MGFTNCMWRYGDLSIVFYTLVLWTLEKLYHYIVVYLILILYTKDHRGKQAEVTESW